MTITFRLLFFVLFCFGLSCECFSPDSIVQKRTCYKSKNLKGCRETIKLYGFFADFPFLTKTPLVKPVPEVPKFDPVTIDPDFRISFLFLSVGFILDLIPYIQLVLGPFVTLLGVLFLVQTFRLRFVFDEDNCLELQTTTSPDKSSGENVIVGGANKWDCDTIVNYDFFPKGWIDSSPTGPILVYFKETQTPSETWNQGPGKSANDPEKIKSGEAIAGQVHFFPAICNAKQIREEFDKRGCRKL